ncbi:MAG: MFS transporter [Promethearchaeota archaeon]
MDEIEKNTTIKRYPKKILASFQLGNFTGLMMSQMYSQQMAFYYQSEIGLNITLYLIAQIAYMIFNMFNDPILGYFCDKSTRFTKKWGKRFPFIIMGSIPYCFMVIFIYMAPKIAEVGQLGVFFWFLFFQCLMDSFFSLYDINRVALFPDKFRHNEDRKIGGAITTYLETIGILLGVIIPVLVVEILGGDAGYSFMAIIVAIIALVAMLLMIPGVREDQDMIQRRIRLDAVETESFFKGMKATLKDRNFIGYMFLFVCYSACMGLVMASIPFVIRDILEMSKIGEMFVLFYILAVLITAPFWYKISHKLGIKKVVIIGASILGLVMTFFLFIPTGSEGIPIAIFGFLAAGAVDGAIITMTMPLFSSVVDKASLNTGKRREGMYQGTFMFFSRISIVIHSTIFWFVQTFLGYDPQGNNTAAQLMGLRIQVGIFPIIIMGIGILVFWKFYKISPEEMEANSQKLIELDI